MEPEKPSEDTYSVALLIFTLLLILILYISYFLQSNRIRIIHETVVSIILGMVVGIIVRLSPQTQLQTLLSFDHRYFFNLLLPVCPLLIAADYIEFRV